ncbi:hypothetical protein J3R82DRAFT_1727 [Butyriboletus roseoflavus]|nr:hypothetical protein J3R82DRAFT_1727 [Butyriboletus roseoflavus]
MSEKSETNSVQSADISQTQQRFNILPHPAVNHIRRLRLSVTNLSLQKSNNPADLVDSGAGLASNPAVLAHHARGPHIPRQDVLNKLDAPLASPILSYAHRD